VAIHLMPMECILSGVHTRIRMVLAVSQDVWARSQPLDLVRTVARNGGQWWSFVFGCGPIPVFFVQMVRQFLSLRQPLNQAWK
jgi:hypothetical protein